MATRQRRGKREQARNTVSTFAKSETRPQTTDNEQQRVMMRSWIARQPVWIGLAVASGACAAINGAFAKLTTTSLTSNLAAKLAILLGLDPDNSTVNVALRGTFFGLNLLFNAIMWALFTAALAKGNSTTRVSIVNVSANFFITAMLGWAIFSERLPMGWWMGAGLLAAGNVVIGRREEGEQKVEDLNDGTQGIALLDEGAQDDLIEVDDLPSSSNRRTMEDEHRLKKAEEADAPL